jgi:hypothetical protein
MAILPPADVKKQQYKNKLDALFTNLEVAIDTELQKINDHESRVSRKDTIDKIKDLDPDENLYTFDDYLNFLRVIKKVKKHPLSSGCF